jgi:hypothetical protein
MPHAGVGRVGMRRSMFLSTKVPPIFSGLRGGLPKMVIFIHKDEIESLMLLCILRLLIFRGRRNYCLIQMLLVAELFLSDVCKLFHGLYMSGGKQQSALST